jgi:hypothetical protein
VLNQSGGEFSLEGVVFRSSRGQWESRSWGPAANQVPAVDCLRSRSTMVGQRQLPAPWADNIYAFLEVGGTALFWIGETSFEEVRNGEVIVVCAVSDGMCSISI